MDDSSVELKLMKEKQMDGRKALMEDIVIG